MVIASNDRYNQLHGYITAWQDLNAFTKDSNRMQIEHLPIIFLIKNFFFLLHEGSFMIEDRIINIIVSLCINHII